MAGLSTALAASTTAIKLAILLIDIHRARILGDRIDAIENALEIGRLLGDSGRLRDAERWFLTASDQAQELGDAFWIARSRQLLGAVAYKRSDFENARELLIASIPSLRDGRDQRFTLDALLQLANAEDKLGHEGAAIVAFDEAAKTALSLGDSERAIWALGDRGGIAYRNHDYKQAEPSWARALALATQKRRREHQAKYMYFLGVVRYQLNQVDEARSLLRDSERLYKRLGRHALAERAAETLARVEAHAGMEHKNLPQG